MAKEVVLVDVDDLGIDALNIREGKWDYDEELVQDIKNRGIDYPLIVRPAAPKTGKKYAIVCGSRRYNAAIEAGLSKVPCYIEKMDDITAIGRTIAENYQREDIPTILYIKKISEMYELLNHRADKKDVVNTIMAKTGFAETTVLEYLDIARLPSEILELMKEPAERSETVKELLKGSLLTTEGKTLSTDKAWKIARELKDFPKKKMFEVAAYVLGLSKEVAFAIIEKVKEYPKKTMEDIHGIVVGIPKGARWVIEFGSHIVAALDEACMRKNIDTKSLIMRYVEDGLRKDGFL